MLGVARTVLLAALTSARSPSPVPRILVLGADHAHVRTEFVEALRIQVVSSATVEQGEDLHGRSLGDRLEEAAAIIEKGQALLVIWIDEAPLAEGSGRESVVYAVTRQRTRESVELGRSRGNEGADVDRALALKVGALLDSVLASAPPRPSPDSETLAAASGEKAQAARPPGSRATPITSPEGTSAAASALALSTRTGDDASRPREDRASSRLRLRFAGEIGAVLSLGTTESTSTQAGLRMTAAGRFEGASWCAEAYGAVYQWTSTDVVSDAGHLTVGERMVGAGVRTLVVRDRFAFGPFLEISARLLNADGVSPAGRTGAVERTVPVWLLGGEVRYAMNGSAAWRASVGLETAIRRQSFAIDGAFVSDLGRVRPTLGFSFVFSVP